MCSAWPEDALADDGNQATSQLEGQTTAREKLDAITSANLTVRNLDVALFFRTTSAGRYSGMGILLCIGIICLSALTGLGVEAFNWYVVYRKPDYQRLKRQIENLAKDLEKKKAEPVGMDNEKKREKNQRVVSRLEKDLQDATKEIQALTMTSKIVTTFLAMAIMFGVNKSFSGVVVAKLPFVPFSLIQKISHRGLEGDDPTDCSVAFLFALCQAGVKGNIAKLVGVSPPKGMKEVNPFADLGAQSEEQHAKTQ